MAKKGDFKPTQKEVDQAITRLKKVTFSGVTWTGSVNRPGFPGECFICELRLPDHYFRWKHNKLFLLLPEE
ncbi:type VI secretion system tube protein Hcp, partial [Escherichia coli]